MKLTVRYGSGFLDQVEERFPAERSLAYSGMTYGEFMNGPVRAARRAFELRWSSSTPKPAARCAPR